MTILNKALHNWFPIPRRNQEKIISRPADEIDRNTDYVRAASEVLRSFIDAESEAAAWQYRERLLSEFVEPVVCKIISARMGIAIKKHTVPRNETEEGAMDIYNNTMIAMDRQLTSWRHQKDVPDCLPCYVKTVTTNNWIHWLRKAKRGYPQGQVHSILTRDGSLTSWEDNMGRKLIGYQAWADNRTPSARDGYISSLHKDPEAFIEAGLIRRPTRKQNLQQCSRRDLLIALLDEARGPVEFEDAVVALGTFPQFRTARVVAAPDAGPSRDSKDADKSIEEYTDRSCDSDDQQFQQAVHQGFLRQLWQEIRNLPLNQRKALLLSLEDIFTLEKITTSHELADSLGLSQTELKSIRLPLQDEVIAQELGCRKKDVQNLRKTALQTIHRRISPYSLDELRTLWNATVALQPPRSTIFMLSHRIEPGTSILHQIAKQSVATKATIANALQLEQKLFDALWDGLPLRFDAIGRALNKTHQEIARLYSEAYEALRQSLKEDLTNL